jgi:glucose-6-phosphate 1-dehydrogenase
MQKLSKSFIFTIFGASGDLAKLKIFPSLFSLALQNRLPNDYAIIGFA